MTTLLLIRHGQTDTAGKILTGRLPGIHLNEKGKQQAQALAEGLRLLSFCALYSSPLERAQETAAPLAACLGLPVQVEAGLAEVDYGEWSGQPLRALRRRKLWQVVKERPAQMVFPGGESLAGARARLAETLTRLAAQHGEKDRIAVFSHSDPIRLAVSYFLAMPLDAFQRLTIDTASVTELYLGEEGIRFGGINQKT